MKLQLKTEQSHSMGGGGGGGGGGDIYSLNLLVRLETSGDICKQ